MRQLIISFLFLFGVSGYSQDFFLYKDSVYKFKIGIPEGWRYGKPKSYPEVLFISIRQTSDTTEKVVESFNVTFVQEPNSSLDTVFSRLLKYNSMADNFSVIEKGSININGQGFKWVISTHTNKYNTQQQMYNYDFITYDGVKAYILTMASTPRNFERYRELFEKIAQTFQVKVLD